MKARLNKLRRTQAGAILFVLLLACGASLAQTTTDAKIERGSQTAKNGFRNESEIRDKFNNWKTDADARDWLAAMNYAIGKIESVVASKPHGEKADVEVLIKLRKSEPGALATGSLEASIEHREGISIKLVSSPNGFNQIDKRWLATYAKLWKMPAAVVRALKLFVGETPPVGTRAGRLRSDKRMFLNELETSQQKAVVDFFTANKDEIVSDLLAGDDERKVGWFMVAFKATKDTRWVIRPTRDAIKFFGEGKVEITRNGNLRIGRITMQRKGGDGGRETAKMLQFKINPVRLFETNVR